MRLIRQLLIAERISGSWSADHRPSPWFSTRAAPITSATSGAIATQPAASYVPAAAGDASIPPSRPRCDISLQARSWPARAQAGTHRGRGPSCALNVGRRTPVTPGLGPARRRGPAACVQSLARCATTALADRLPRFSSCGLHRRTPCPGPGAG
jgi:hypothetical protein